MALDLKDSPWYVAPLIGVVLAGILFYLADSQFYKPKQKEIENVQTQIEGLINEVRKGETAKKNLPRLEAEIKNLEGELERLKLILPTKRDTDDLIKKLRQLTESGNFTLKSFRPSGYVDKGFYLEWPIPTVLEGTYHELGRLFDQLSKYSRIINVPNLTITPLKGKGKNATVTSNFTLMTFIYKEES